MSGLHARDDVEPREPGDVGVAHQLRVLDRSCGSGCREAVERVGDGDVADRVHGGAQTAARRAGEVLDQLVRLDVEVAGRAVRLGAAAGAVCVRARRRARAERTVADHLVRPHPDEPAPVEGVSRCEPVVQRLLEAVRIGRHVDPQQVEAGRRPTCPVVSAPFHVHVDDADDAAGSRTAGHLLDGAIERGLVEIAEAPRQLERVLLAHESVAAGPSLAPQCSAVQPGAVKIGVDEVRRRLPRVPVEHVETRRLGPQRVAEAGADAAAVTQHGSIRHRSRRFNG